jgi:hypothetical protein
MNERTHRFSSFLWRWALVFFTLYVATLTFDYHLFGALFDAISVPFRYLAEFTGQLFFGVNLIGAGKFYSDSLIVYVHLFNIALISLLGSAAWTILSKPSTPRDGGQALILTRFTDTKFYLFLLTLLRYFVAFNLLVYGFSKLYKWQFMLPEPNLLYTTVGEMHRDILYWTSMGTSRSYSIFMGVIEIIPAVLLLFRKTTLVGALIAVMVLANVVAVNFGFDITVKLHSMALLLMSLVMLIPARKRIVELFTGKAAGEFTYPTLKIIPSRKWISPAIKIALIVLLLMEAHYPYTTTGIFNDDAADRQPMHGAYEVTNGVYTDYRDPDTLQSESPVKMIFINRRDYIIFQFSDGTTADYPMEIEKDSSAIHYGYGDGMYTFLCVRNSDSTYLLSGFIEDPNVSLEVKRLDLSKLPLLEEEFTWIDED